MDMVRLHIKNLRPISLNRLHYRNRKLTQEARIYRASFLSQLQAYSDELSALSKAFQPTKNSLALSLTFKMPQSEFYTQKGTVSARSQDLDNLLKLNIDCLCNTKYTTPKWLQEKLAKPRERGLYRFAKSLNSLNNLHIDDRFITKISTNKEPVDGPHELIIDVCILKLS